MQGVQFGCGVGIGVLSLCTPNSGSTLKESFQSLHANLGAPHRATPPGYAFLMQFCRVLVLFFGLFLAGCATTQMTQAPMPGEQKLQGLFGVVTQNQSQSGHFIWSQQSQSFTLELYGPLGLGATTLTDTASGVSLKTSNGKVFKADSPEDLLQEVLGWSMPVEGFKYWLWGLPEPNVPYQATYDDTNHIATLNQEGWQMTYTWQESNIKKIVMLRDGVRVTIVYS